MPLRPLLDPDRVAMLSGPLDRDRVLDEAARLLTGDAPDRAEPIAECLRQRERLGSTAIGHGVAIPHGRCGAFGQARAAFLRLAEPVEFDAGDGEPVDLVFAMTVPEQFTQQHLQLLSEVAEYFADPARREALRNAPDLAALRALLDAG
jgi:PTS system nitrogen regulatory IIA component